MRRSDLPLPLSHSVTEVLSRTESVQRSYQSHIPAGLEDVALIEGAGAAAVGKMSISWWLGEVAAGRAPQPVIRKPRCTRWSVVQVREFWANAALQADSDVQSTRAVTERAVKASAAAKAKRVAMIADR